MSAPQSRARSTADLYEPTAPDVRWNWLWELLERVLCPQVRLHQVNGQWHQSMLLCAAGPLDSLWFSTPITPEAAAALALRQVPSPRTPR